MFRRILGVALMVIGLAIAGAAVGSATIWKPDEVVTLSATSQDPYIVTAPGVLDVVSPDVDIRLTGSRDEEPLVMILAQEHEILAWLGEETTYTEITGLESWETLTTNQVTPETGTEPLPEPQPDPVDGEEPAEPAEPAEPEQPAEPLTLDPRGSDLWNTEVTDDGVLTYSWESQPGRWMILAASDGESAAPRVSLTWTREVPTPLLMPGIIAGAFIFLVGLVLSIFTFLALREAKRAKAQASEDQTHELPEDLDTSNFTRRQVRELHDALATTGEIPVHLLQLGQADTGDHEAVSAVDPQLPDYDPLDDLLVVPESLEQNSGGQDLAEWVKSAPSELAPQGGYFAAGVRTGASAASPEEDDEDREDFEDSGPIKPKWQDIWSRWAEPKPSDGAPATSAQSAPSAGTPAGVEELAPDRTEVASAASPQISGAHWRQTWRQALNQEELDETPRALESEGDER